MREQGKNEDQKGSPKRDHSIEEPPSSRRDVDPTPPGSSRGPDVGSPNRDINRLDGDYSIDPPVKKK